MSLHRPLKIFVPHCSDLLTDHQATRSAIETQLLSLAKCSADDVMVVAFSCHGTPGHHLASYDADPGDLAGTAIPLSLLGTWFAGSLASGLLLLIQRRKLARLVSNGRFS